MVGKFVLQGGKMLAQDKKISKDPYNKYIHLLFKLSGSSDLALSDVRKFAHVFAGGNVQHDYYQVLMVPSIAWFVAKGAGLLLRPSQTFYRAGARTLLVVSLAFCWAFSWYTVRTYYWINRPEIVEAGAAADALLPKDAKVIASYNGDTTFLYQTGRQGWPLGFDIDQKIAMGATHYVTVSPGDEDGETRALASEYTVLVRNDTYAIIDLTRPRK